MKKIEKVPLLRKKKVFYGYWIITVAFICILIPEGSLFYTFGLYVKPLQTDFGWGRGEIMVAFTLACMAMGIAAPFIGRMVDQYGARKVTASGAVVGGLGLILLSLTRNLWYFYIGYIISGIGHAAVGQIPMTAVVSNWFKKRRGTAIGIVSVGVGAGGFILAPLVGGYLIPNYGWRAAYIALALLTWILIPLILFVIRTKPADMGLYPDGAEAPETVTEAQVSIATSAEGLTLKMALATSVFWLIAVSFLAHNFSQVGIIQNQVPYLEDIGLPVAMAATALGAVGMGSAMGKFIFGWLCDKMPAKYACCISLGLQIVATVILMNMNPESSMAIVWLYVIIMGLGLGGWLPTVSMLCSTNFGLASYGAIYGIINFVMSIGAATGPFVAGYMYDTMNTYYWAFSIFLAIYIVSLVTVLLIRRPKAVLLDNIKMSP